MDITDKEQPSVKTETRRVVEKSLLKKIVVTPETALETEVQKQFPRETYKYVFNFPDRRVAGTIIACGHSDKEDTSYVLQTLDGFTTDRTLFIEEGSPKQPGHTVARLKEIAARNPVIADDFERRLKFGHSTLDPKNQTGPFVEASDLWMARGGIAVNMDLSGNLTDEAVNFLLANTFPEFSIEFVYSHTDQACYLPRQTMPLLMQEIFPNFSSELINQVCERLYPFYDTFFTRKERYKKRRLEEYTLRERYMRKILQDKMKPGDIILAHPIHIKRLTKEDKTATEY